MWDKADAAVVAAHVANVSNPHTVTKSQVGLGSVLDKEQVAKDGTVAMTGSLSLGAGLTVDGRDISAMVRAKILTGTYTGDDNDDRNINIGVDLTAKSNVFVIVQKVTYAYAPQMRAEMGQGDSTKPFDDVAEQGDRIQAITTTGFQLGTHVTVNASGLEYRYIVTYEEP